jgi:hypothetical protein
VGFFLDYAELANLAIRRVSCGGGMEIEGVPGWRPEHTMNTQAAAAIGLSPEPSSKPTSPKPNGWVRPMTASLKAAGPGDKVPLAVAGPASIKLARLPFLR